MEVHSFVARFRCDRDLQAFCFLARWRYDPHALPIWDSGSSKRKSRGVPCRNNTVINTLFHAILRRIRPIRRLVVAYFRFCLVLTDLGSSLSQSEKTPFERAGPTPMISRGYRGLLRNIGSLISFSAGCRVLLFIRVSRTPYGVQLQRQHKNGADSMCSLLLSIDLFPSGSEILTEIICGLFSVLQALFISLSDMRLANRLSVSADRI